MCGRFALGVPHEQLKLDFGLDDCADFPVRYNIPPGSDIPVIRQSPEGRRVLHLLHWGLIPRWVKDVSKAPMLNNARGETVAEKPSYRSAYKSRRCLIPASGFFEWKKVDGVKQPFFISLKSGKPMAFAGLWEAKDDMPDGSVLRTTCIITTSSSAHEIMEPIHDRMPVIIAPENWKDWLSAPADDVGDLISQYDATAMQAWTVSRRVNKTGEEGADLIESVAVA